MQAMGRGATVEEQLVVTDRVRPLDYWEWQIGICPFDLGMCLVPRDKARQSKGQPRVKTSLPSEGGQTLAPEAPLVLRTECLVFKVRLAAKNRWPAVGV